MIERERRFLVGDLPGSLPEPVAIVQAYLTVEPVSTRVRRIGDGHTMRHTLTVKAGAGLARTEVEREITAIEFDELWPHAQALRISKQRHHVMLEGGETAELDLFGGELAGRQIVEVEFDSDVAAGAFTPPAWFGREVTDDGRFTNAALAQYGWPDSSRDRRRRE